MRYPDKFCMGAYRKRTNASLIWTLVYIAMACLLYGMGYAQRATIDAWKIKELSAVVESCDAAIQNSYLGKEITND